MSKLKKVLVVLLVILVVIQFIRPDKNIGNSYGANDVTQAIATSNEVKIILDKACMDCHSNNTSYPWYNNIQPVAFWLANHVDEGKEELNFSEFKTYKLKRQDHKLEEVVEMIQEGEMPLSSYTITHGDAKLTEAEKSLLINWANEGRKALGVPQEEEHH
jgi:hypothetical protein